jgi:hypothetical protein
VNPVRSEFALCWHRDDIKGSASEDEEQAGLTVRHYGVRQRNSLTLYRTVLSEKKGPVEYVSTWPRIWQNSLILSHSALYEDASLYIVPGSHRVPRKAAQRALSSDSTAPADPLAMPGAIVVHLNGNVAYSRVVFLSNLRL